MMWPALEALRELGGSGSNAEIDERAVRLMGLSEQQQRILHGQGPLTEVRYRLHWARTYLKAVNALENTRRGVWAITDYGRSLTANDMSGIPVRVRSRHKDKRKNYGEGNGGQGKGDDQAITSTDLDAWRQKLLSVVLEIPPSDFEKLCQRVLREAGFTKVEVTGRSGDGGIDGIGVLRVALLSFQVFFQCKRYRGSVGASAIRDFRGAMVGRTDKGLLITTGAFTSEAMREATRDGAPVLDLIDGESLCDLLKQLKLGVSTEQVEAVTIHPSWFRSL